SLNTISHRRYAYRLSLRPPTLSMRYTPPHRHLPSFPTRRSSDLRRGTGRSGARSAGFRRRGLPSESQASSFRPPLQEIPFHCTRSEEHTSELQSRSDLVCRLLLEKKN